MEAQQRSACVLRYPATLPRRRKHWPTVLSLLAPLPRTSAQQQPENSVSDDTNRLKNMQRTIADRRRQQRLANEGNRNPAMAFRHLDRRLFLNPPHPSQHGMSNAVPPLPIVDAIDPNFWPADANPGETRNNKPVDEKADDTGLMQSLMRELFDELKTTPNQEDPPSKVPASARQLQQTTASPPTQSDLCLVAIQPAQPPPLNLPAHLSLPNISGIRLSTESSALRTGAKNACQTAASRRSLSQRHHRHQVPLLDEGTVFLISCYYRIDSL